MPDMHFEETCPCGNSTKCSGYSSYVTPQILAWRKIHNPHANSIAKAIAESRTKTYTWPWTSTITTTNPNYHLNTGKDPASDRSTQEENKEAK